MPLTTTPSGRIGRCTRMRRFFVRFIRPESFVRTRSSAGFTIITSGFEFSVHTVMLDSPETIGKAMPLFKKGLLDRIVTASTDGGELSDVRSGSASDLTRGVVSLQALLNNDGRYERPALDPVVALAVLQYTGGTTGSPKGAMLTHANLTTNARQTRVWFPSLADGSERLLIPLPFSHITGITVC